MTLVPEIREQLLDAAFGSAESDPSRGRRSGRLAIAVSITVSVAIAAVALLSLHGSPSGTAGPAGSSATPPSGAAPGPLSPPPPLAWVNALGRAGRVTFQRDPACRSPSNGGPRHPRFLSTRPPRTITDAVPSLASPAQGAQRVTFRELRAANFDATGIYVRYVRQGHADGVHYYVIPAVVVGRTEPLSAACYRKALAVFRKQARRFPAGQRAAAIAYARQRLNPRAEVGISIVTAGWGVSGEDSYPAWRLAQLNTDPSIGGGSWGSNDATTTTLLVGDAVASVTATYPAQHRPGRVPRTFSVTKRPVRNVVIFHLSGAWDPPQLTFRSTTGVVIAQKHKH